jgi:nucleoside phosphorylase
MPTVDFAILTGLVQEMETVLSVFPKAEEVSENTDIWYRTRVVGTNSENYEIVAAYQTGMGPLSAQALTARVIERWDPAYIILVGIAGSFSKDVKLGDVIAANRSSITIPARLLQKGFLTDLKVISVVRY